MSRVSRILLATCLSMAALAAALAQPAFPSRPVRIIVPYTAGGSAESACVARRAHRP